MSLNDEIVARVMGELDALTKRIDNASKNLSKASGEVNVAAERIKQNSETSVKSAKDAAYQAQMESAAQVEIKLAANISRTLSEVAQAGAIASAAKWVIAGVALAGILTILAGAVGYHKGKYAGRSEGYAEMRDEKAAANWANTPQGRRAYRLAKVGSLDALANCDRPGWVVEDGLCNPKKAPNGQYGWKL